MHTANKQQTAQNKKHYANTDLKTTTIKIQDTDLQISRLFLQIHSPNSPKPPELLVA